MRVAIVHDWLVTYAGAEKVIEQILNIYPNADLYSLVDFIPDKNRGFLKGKSAKTTFIQKFPFAKSKYRQYLPLMPLAMEQLDLSSYDLVISSSSAVAKGIITGPDQMHICYCHSPIRYAWDLQHQYLKESGLEKGIKGLVAKLILHYIRNWDYRTSNGVDFFISNSDFIGRRIWKVYRRKSTTIYPPVDVASFSLHEQKEDFFLTASRMVPYKKIDIIVEAFSKLPNKTLVVIGDGPDFNKIKSKAGPNVKMLGYKSNEVLIDYMQRAKAFIFAAEEDFGITPVEAQACGTPVIAYGKGGTKETIRGLFEDEKPTGIFFKEQTSTAIVQAIKEFENNKECFLAKNCRENAVYFSKNRFINEFSSFINDKLSN